MERREAAATILVVDDDPVAAGALAEILKPDFNVVVVHDGFDAIEVVCSGHAPDLVLLDVEMPGMDGYETCQRLQSRRPTESVPVIFVTSSGDPASEARALELGAADFIVKPAHPTVVRARVRSHLRVHRRTSMLSDLIGRDPLTQLANRRRFDTALEEECRRADRTGAPLSVAFVDVDYFKVFNDTYGHVAGDECLRRVARALSNSLPRAGDLVARYGGEEFVALLPDTDLKGAQVVAQRFCAAVEGLRMPNPGSAVEIYVTVSVGTVTAEAPGLTGQHEQLLRAADRLLYAAKERGRNCVVQGEFADGEPLDEGDWERYEESGVRSVVTGTVCPIRRVVEG